jgi:hypothetical protein
MEYSVVRAQTVNARIQAIIVPRNQSEEPSHPSTCTEYSVQSMHGKSIRRYVLRTL